MAFSRETLIEYYENKIRIADESIRDLETKKRLYEDFIKNLSETEFSYPLPIHNGKGGVVEGDYKTTIAIAKDRISSSPF